MCFFKKRKARKLAEQQKQTVLTEKKTDQAVVEQQKVEVAKPIVEQQKVEAAKPIVEQKKVEAAKPIVEQKTSDVTKAKPAKYHVSQNKDPKSDNHKNWRVRKEGSTKTIKFFDTQKEAIDYANELAETAGSSVVVHKLDGSIRKQDYSKKQ